MLPNEAALVLEIVQETNRYLDRLQSQALLWTDVDNHIAASHIAEHMGDFVLVSRHLQTVTRLLIEIHDEPHPEETLPAA